MHPFTPSFKYLVFSALLALSTPHLFAQDQEITIQSVQQPLLTALQHLSSQAKLQLIVNPALMEGKIAPTLSGTMPLNTALQKLLEGTHLSAKIEDGIIVISELANVNMLSAIGIEATADKETYTVSSMSVATGLHMSMRETPQSISVISRKMLDDQNSVDMEKALSKTTGVNINHAGEQISFQSRGFRMSSIQYDGMLTNYQSMVATDDTAILDRIEVLRGAAGLMQGAGDPGGTINIVRKRPTSETLASVISSVGSWDTYRVQTDVSSALNDEKTLRGRLVTVYQDKESFVDTVESERKVAYGIFEYDITPDTMITFGSSIHKETKVPMIYGLPMYTNGNDIKLDRSTYYGASWNTSDIDNKTFFAELSSSLANDIQLNGAINYREATKNDLYAEAYGAVDPALNTTRLSKPTRSEVTDHQLSVSLKASKYTEVVGLPLELVAGGNYNRYDYRRDYGSTGSRTTIDINNFDPNSVAQPSTIPTDEYADEQIRQYGLHTMGRLDLSPAWHLILGARLSWYDMVNDDGYEVQTFTTDAEVTPYAGLVWDFAENYSWYVSYTDIFTPQSYYKDSNNQMLDPVVGSNYETGIKGELFNGALNASVALFRIDKKNAAVLLPQFSASCWMDESCRYGTAKLRSQGVEVEMSGELAKNWHVNTGYTYTENEYIKHQSSEGQHFSLYTPEHMLRLSTDYRLPAELYQWNIGGGVTAQSKIKSANNIEQSGYGLLDLHVGYALTPKLKFSLSVNNVFDKWYYQTYSSRSLSMGSYYGDPRNAMLSVKWDY